MCLDFLYSFCLIYSKKNRARCCQTVNSCSCKVPVILVGFFLNKLEFSRRIFEKYKNVKFNENPSGGSRVVPCGQTDGGTNGHDEDNSRFS